MFACCCLACGYDGCHWAVKRTVNKKYTQEAVLAATVELYGKAMFEHITGTMLRQG